MAKTSTTPRAKKAASLPAHPKYEDMIRAIKKYILTSFKLPDNTVTNNRLRIAINKGVEKGLFAFYNGMRPSGTIKLVKKEPVKKEKKEVEKKEKPKAAVKKESKPKAEKPFIAENQESGPQENCQESCKENDEETHNQNDQTS
ncbi:286_t:CDS:2 [Racocetra fulgida]|uniref:Histone H1 n=1 Tax=Racocetra fulgida TaxID=60492 RepID=A0A9N9J4Q6_9GLOM|nr:286_t:CDS:2 [Racocetra fulgida]